MPIEWGLIQTASSTGAGLAGVWLGGRLTWQRDDARERDDAAQLQRVETPYRFDYGLVQLGTGGAGRKRQDPSGSFGI